MGVDALGRESSRRHTVGKNIFLRKELIVKIYGREEKRGARKKGVLGPPQRDVVSEGAEWVSKPGIWSHVSWVQTISTIK